MLKVVIAPELGNEAGVIYQCASRVENDIKMLEYFVQQIPEHWVGEDATSFTRTLEEIIPTLKKYKESMFVYADYLSKINKVYQALEDSYNRSIV